ncbi:MAG: hypothetical protein LBI06_04915, partial [Treponema sp.]|nr:hypothetical protein [Treponema sp.]
MNRKSILVVPACESGRGGGHLTRCMKLVRDLRTLGREAWLFADRLLDVSGFDRGWLIKENAFQNTHWEWIILDRFQTSPEELARWTKLAPIIGIDEGGPHRNHFDFLIDILPNCNRIGPNIADPSLLPLPEKQHPKLSPETTPLKILITFGHENAAGLGPAAAKALAAKNTGNIDVALLKGGLHSPLPNLNEHLSEYGLIITHYGLTAFESLYAGVPVLLVSPGAYHEKLAKTAGFYSVGIGKNKAAKLARLLSNKGELNRAFIGNLKNRCAVLATQYSLDHAPRQSLAELINGFAPNVSRNCPACGSLLHGAAIARFAER